MKRIKHNPKAKSRKTRKREGNILPFDELNIVYTEDSAFHDGKAVLMQEVNHDGAKGHTWSTRGKGAGTGAGRKGEYNARYGGGNQDSDLKKYGKDLELAVKMFPKKLVGDGRLKVTSDKEGTVTIRKEWKNGNFGEAKIAPTPSAEHYKVLSQKVNSPQNSFYKAVVDSPSVGSIITFSALWNQIEAHSNFE